MQKEIDLKILDKKKEQEKCMKRITIFLLMFIVLGFNNIYAEIINDQEIKLIEDMLSRRQLNLNDLNFLKDWGSDTQFKLPVVLKVLSDPLYYAEFADSVRNILKRSNPYDINNLAVSILVENSREDLNFSDHYRKMFKDLVKNKKKHLPDYLSACRAEINVVHKIAWEHVTEAERDTLTAYALSMYGEAEDSLKINAILRKLNLNQIEGISTEDTIIPIIKKINFEALLYAGYRLKAVAEVVIEEYKNEEMKLKKPYVKKTHFGKIVIGSTNDDVYTDDCCIIVDFAGNDTYECNISSTFGSPLSMIIDFKGDDVYRNNDMAAMLSAIGGFSVFSDLEGDDYYDIGDMSFSSIFGYFYAEDHSGNDSYRTGYHSLGASTFGLGVHVDRSGNDMYNTTQYGEGYAGPLGVGILADLEGSDIYFAGGKYMHKPLAPYDSRSMGQGFSFGFRGKMGGGVGILFDHAGNDRYMGGVYSQAGAYWYALGMLLDDAGNDFYNSVYYPQGSGIHLAAGFLFDGEGEDHYHSKHGPGQGAGHDYGVGFMIDHSGNDSYSVEGGNGLGLTNSVGVFIDRSGDDKYQMQKRENFGFANTARSAGGIGIFMDTGGKDQYPVPADSSRSAVGENSRWITDMYGFGIDTLMVEVQKKIEEEAEEMAAEVDSTAAIKEIFGIASEWGVGNNKERVEKALSILFKRDEEAAEYIFNNRMNTKSGLVLRAIGRFLKESDAMNQYFPKGLELEDSTSVKNTIRFIASKKDTTYVSRIKGFIDNKQYVATCLSALGALHTNESINILKSFTTNSSEKLRFITAASLKAFKTDETDEILYTMENDESFLVKSMIRLHKRAKKKK